VGGRTGTGGINFGVGGRGSSSSGGSSVALGGSATGGSSSATGGTSASTGTSEKFSFFVISYAAIKALSGSDQGFGGDLRYGETGDGAGLRGADKICAAVADRSMKGNGKTWRAYLSTSTVNAIDRIGKGPWYDRRGRTIALDTASLLSTRPKGADSAIKDDLPNEDGVANHAPDGSQVDNHDTLTGTDHQGKLYGANAHCVDWTSSAKDTSKKPRVGHSWPRGMVDTGNTPGMSHWASALDESGCGAGVNLIETGPPLNDGVVGSGGGYGGFYCFALTP
jgi:hypothetical protein